MNKKNSIITFIIIILLSCIIFYNFLNMHYATDTYNIIDRGYKDYAIKYSINDGRVFMGFISLFAEFVKLPITLYIILLTLFSIFTSCISVMLIKKIVLNYKMPKSILEDILLTLICYSTIWNFMFLENMQFAECFVMSLSILFYIIAANIFTSKQNYYFIKSLIFVVFGIFSYQGTLGYFVVMSLIISILKKDKHTIANIFVCGIICIIACIINFIQMRLFASYMGLGQRVDHFQSVFNMFIVIIKYLKSIIVYTADIFPKYYFIMFITVLIITSILLIKEEINAWFYHIVLLIIITLGSTFAINLFTTAGFGTARMMFCLGSLIGNIFILIYVNTDLIQEKNLFIISILVFYVLSIIITYTTTIYKHKIVEKLTKEECRIINEYILEYEEESGNKLDKIAVYRDSNVTYFYNDINNYSALCIRPLSVEWADNGSINLYCNTKLVEIDPDSDIYNTYFKDKNWNKINKEQFVFIDDVMHYCIY